MGCIQGDSGSDYTRSGVICGFRVWLSRWGRKVAVGLLAVSVMSSGICQDPQPSLPETLVGQMAFTIMNMIQDVMPVIMGIFAVMMGIGLIMGLFRLIVNRFS